MVKSRIQEPGFRSQKSESTSKKEEARSQVTLKIPLLDKERPGMVAIVG
jgi:hypothetical protein